MDLTSISAIFISILFSVISIVFALQERKRAKKAEQEIVDLKKAMISHKYLKELAFTQYSNGKYEECLDVFKKYLSGNRDNKEWNEIIHQICKSETLKIFSDTLVFTEGAFPSISLLIQSFISLENKYVNSPPYPTLIKELLNDYSKVFEHNYPSYEFIIALFDKDWTKAKKLLPEITLLKDEEINVFFKNYVLQYLNKKLGINEEQSNDDLEF